MTKQIAIYHDTLRYDLTLLEGRRYQLGNSESSQLFIDGLENPIVLTLEENQVFYQVDELCGTIEDGTELAGLTFFLLNETFAIYDLMAKKDLLLGAKANGDIYFQGLDFEALLQNQDKTWNLVLLSGTLYVNNHLFKGKQLALPLGAEIALEGVLVKVFPDEIWLRGSAQVAPSLVQKAESRYSFYEEYPDYHRSPRIIYRSSEDKIQINAPEREPKKPENGLLRMIVPPLVMIAVMILISIIQPRGIYMLMMLAMSTTTIVFSVTTYFKNRNKYKQDLKDRISSYKRYLMDKSKELAELASDQKKGQLYHYPSIEAIDQLSSSYNHRIYEKTPLHFDFLHYRLGLGQVPTSYDLRYSQTERSGQTDPLEAEGYKLYTQNRTIAEMPIVANLANGPVGYIGPRPLVIEQLQLMVNQLALFHSYHDVQFITIMPEEEKEQWEWMRWLPHATLQEMNVRGFVYNQRTRDQVLNSLNQILKMRQNQTEDKSAKESLLFSPHYVVLVTDEKLILDHVIMEFFTEDPTELGCSVIFVEDVLSSLSENIKTIINIKDRNYGQLVMEEGELKEIDFALDHFPLGFDKEGISRRLAPLNHLQNLKSSIPESVTFMEMYRAETFEDLQVPSRWETHAPYKSLAVPLGLRGQDDLVYLNLHEKAHGPHGLIAGTTGSGKSELIQSYILSLAVNFHPYDVAFLLIDYKGGGMANLFRNLPHLLGTITNLDGAQSMRALVSINAELKRRQRLFAKYDVNHINQYQKKYKLGEATEPMPHLFLISDEFAELKQNQPDFMTELVSTARIGRSLGIHLILATQKPTGVVNDQIWSNSRFKIALKVADRQDSNEMLHTPDAAEITQAGRAYLQVGNNEVYELFQSAWSGADYQPEKDDQGIEDHTIYAINSLGQYDILNEDLSGLEEAEDIRQVPSELDAIVDKLKELVESMGVKPQPQPWLPALPSRLFVTDLERTSPASAEDDLQAVLGLVDIPSEQKQIVASHSFAKDGHLALFSGPGMGKTTFLQTVTMDLVRQYNPEQLHLYLMDFGTNGLLPLLGLPHTADIIYSDDSAKILKLINRITDELRYRKTLFSGHMVPNLEAYHRVSDQRLPRILIVIDSYEGLKNTPQELAVDNFLAMVARDGSNMGIHIVLSTGRLGTIRAALQSNIKTKLCLKMADESESKTIVGRHQLIMEDMPGRGLIRIDQPEVLQIAMPVKGEDNFAIQEALKAEVASMDEAWHGERPSRIPIVPDMLSYDNFSTMPTTKEAVKKGHLPIGLDYGDVVAVSLSIKDMGHLLIEWDKQTVRRIVLNHLIKMTNLALGAEVTTIYDVENIMKENVADAGIYHDLESVDINSTLAGDNLKEQIMKERRERYYEDRFVFIPDLNQFLERTQLSDNDFALIYEEGQKVGFHFIMATSKAYLVQRTAIQRYLEQRQNNAIIAGMKMGEQTFFKRSSTGAEPALQDDQIYLHHKDEQTLLKIIK